MQKYLFKLFVKFLKLYIIRVWNKNRNEWFYFTSLCAYLTRKSMFKSDVTLTNSIIANKRVEIVLSRISAASKSELAISEIIPVSIPRSKDAACSLLL